LHSTRRLGNSRAWFSSLHCHRANHLPFPLYPTTIHFHRTHNSLF
jgi:hypothetical protein